MSKIAPPNYTQIPNLILDAYLPAMSEAELKITLAISRQTFGWHREQAALSLSRLQKMTGLSRQGVINGITSGMERGTIYRQPRGQGFEYGLIVDDELVNEVDQHQSTKLTSTSQPNRPAPVNEVDHIKETKKPKETEEKKKTGAWAAARRPLPGKFAHLDQEPDPAAVLVAHMQKLIDQPRGLLKKYKAAAGITALGEADHATITAWIDHYLAKTAGRDGISRDKAAALAYTAISAAEPAPVSAQADPVPAWASHEWEPDPDPAPAQPEPVPSQPDTPAGRLWGQALEQLARQTTQATFAAHLRATTLAEMDTHTGRAVIQAPSREAAAWIDQRMIPAIRRTLGGLLQQSVAVELVAAD